MPNGIQDINVNKVDLIYTKRGRFLKSINSPKSAIVKFALSDDGVDYNLYDENAVEGKEGLRILRTPQLESFTSENGMMRNKLISLERDVTETSQMEVSPQSILFEVDPNTSSKVMVEAITIRADFPAPNGFIVAVDNAEYIYVNKEPIEMIEFPESLYPNTGMQIGGEDNLSDEREPERTLDGNDPIPRRINTHTKGDKTQRLIVGKNASKPNETIIRVYYDDRYKKFTEDVPVTTRIVIESIDGGYTKEVEVELRKLQ